MKIIEHFTLAQNCVTDLDKDINDAIKKGYEIYGEFQSTDEGLVIQRMVKYETEDPSVIDSLKKQTDWLLSGFIETIKPLVVQQKDDRGTMYTYQDIGIYKRDDSVTQFCPYTVIVQCIADRKNKVRNEDS